MKRRYYLIFLLIITAIGLTGSFFYFSTFVKIQKHFPFTRKFASVAATVSAPFSYTFNVDGVVDETGSMADSSSPYWWINSGGQFIIKDGVGKTAQGELSLYSRWRLIYSLSNPRDTDDGYHPQNIFRLLTRSKWKNFEQQLYIKIVKINMSKSQERDAWNGILLFNRYIDGDNLYYTGIRNDGRVIIKKKIRGVYYTMAEKTFYTGDASYNRDTNPNLIPGKKWIGLKSQITNNPDGTVSIKVFIDKDKTNNWILAIQAIDNGRSYGGGAFLTEGYAGIRTDYMDVEFDDYLITEQSFNRYAVTGVFTPKLLEG